MELLTDEIKAALPMLGMTEGTPVDQKEIICKFFNPMGAGTWYVVEGEQEPDGEWLFFGLVDLLEKEWGYFTLSQLTEIKLPFGMGVERDIHWGNEADGLTHLTQIQDVTKVNFARYC